MATWHIHSFFYHFFPWHVEKCRKRQNQELETHPRLVNEGVQVDQLLGYINLILDLERKEKFNIEC